MVFPQQHGSFITGRVAKRAKVIFSQVSVCPTREGGGGGQPWTRSQHLPPPPSWDQVTTPPSLPLGPGHNTSLPHIPLGPSHNTSLIPRDQITTPPSLPLAPGHNTPSLPPLVPGHNTLLPPGTRSQHLPPSPWHQVTTPPSPPGTRSQHLPPSPWHQVTNTPSLPPGTRSQHPPPPWDQVTTPPPLTPPPGTMSRWAVRILLECILVSLSFLSF